MALITVAAPVTISPPAQRHLDDAEVLQAEARLYTPLAAGNSA
jgi:hypothetical protein